MKYLLDDTKLTFGKYKGSTPNEIANDNPSYIVWLFDNLDTKFCTKKLRNACEDVSESSYEDSKGEDSYYGLDGW